MAESTQRGIDRLLILANRIEQATEAATPVGRRYECRDKNEQVLVAAYGRAARCFRSIRFLAAQSLGEDALVLTRTLLSVAVHSLYLISSEDASERRSRLDRWAVGFIDRLTRQEKELKAWGLQREGLEALREGRQKIQSRNATKIEAFPSEGHITKMLGDPWPLLYSQIFRTASEATHFSMASVLDTFEEGHRPVRTVRLDQSDPALTNDALLYGILTYGSFLEPADVILRTGAAANVTHLIRRSGIRIVK